MSRIQYMWLWLLIGLSLPLRAQLVQPVAFAPKAASPGAEPEKMALLVHINAYQNWNSLAIGDGLGYLQKALLRQGFKRDKQIVCRNEQATVRQVRSAFHQLIHRLKGKAGTMVTIVLDGHGHEIPDLDGDERQKPLQKLLPDEFDEAFVAYDSPQSDSKFELTLKNTDPKRFRDYCKRFLLDDELAMYYDSIRRTIGPTGHLVVLLPGCHSYSGSKGGKESGKVEPFIPDETPSNVGNTASADESRLGQSRLGQFIYFASVANDTNKVHPNLKRRASAAVYGFAQALYRLTPNHTYRDLLADITRIIMPDVPKGERNLPILRLNPVLSPDSDSWLRVFGGYVTVTPLGAVQQIAGQIKAKVPALWNQWITQKSSATLRNQARAKGVPPEPPSTERLVLVHEGKAAGQLVGRVVEFADRAGNSVVLGEVEATDDSNSIIRLDRAVSVINCSLRRPSLTLWLYADSTVNSVLLDSLRHWVGLAERPEQAQLRLTYGPKGYRLCAQGLPYSASGCGQWIKSEKADLGGSESLLLRKIRGLALYQVLRQKENRQALGQITYLQAQQEEWVFAPEDSLQPDKGRKISSPNEPVAEGMVRKKVLVTIPEAYFHGNFLVIDTLTSSLILKHEPGAEQIGKWFYQYINVSPDQPLEGVTQRPISQLGRIVSVGVPSEKESPAEYWIDSSRATTLIEGFKYGPPLGLKENAFVFAASPLPLRALLEGKTRLSLDLISQIAYVKFYYYFTVPDRRPYQKK